MGTTWLNFNWSWWKKLLTSPSFRNQIANVSWNWWWYCRAVLGKDLKSQKSWSVQLISGSLCCNTFEKTIVSLNYWVVLVRDFINTMVLLEHCIIAGKFVHYSQVQPQNLEICSAKYLMNSLHVPTLNGNNERSCILHFCFDMHCRCSLADLSPLSWASTYGNLKKFCLSFLWNCLP